MSAIGRPAPASITASSSPRERQAPYASSVANAASRPLIRRSRSSPGSTRFAYASRSRTARKTSRATSRGASTESPAAGRPPAPDPRSFDPPPRFADAVTRSVEREPPCAAPPPRPADRPALLPAPRFADSAPRPTSDREPPCAESPPRATADRLVPSAERGRPCVDPPRLDSGRPAADPAELDEGARRTGRSPADSSDRFHFACAGR